MSYAAVVDLIEAYGLQELYELLSDENGLITAQLVSDAVAGSPLDDYTADQIDAVTAALARAANVLERQSSVMNGALASRYALPLDADAEDANGALFECCLALTRAALADDGDNVSTTMKEERSYWRDWLKRIERGETRLVNVEPISAGGTNQRLTAPAPSDVNWTTY